MHPIADPCTGDPDVFWENWAPTVSGQHGGTEEQAVSAYCSVAVLFSKLRVIAGKGRGPSGTVCMAQFTYSPHLPPQLPWNLDADFPFSFLRTPSGRSTTRLH